MADLPRMPTALNLRAPSEGGRTGLSFQFFFSHAQEYPSFVSLPLKHEDFLFFFLKKGR